ncbi:MAG: hypothetical protein K0Q67_1718 [Cellvibrio sp.]|nr:hypothetical protein [Cellvibrio sp.]
MRFFIIILFFSSYSVADGVTFKKNTGPIEKHEKACLNQPPPTHQAMFYQSELCEFGKQGCDENNSRERFEVLCDLDRVSQCYAQKGWRNRNQYFNLSPSVDVTNIGHTISISNGIKVDTICAYYLP